MSSPASAHRRAPSNASQTAQQFTSSTPPTIPDPDEEDQFTDIDTSRFPEAEGATSDLDAMGHLSIDDHKDVRYHGRTSGLHLLANASSMSSLGSRDKTGPNFANPSLSSNSNQGTNVALEENARHRNGFWRFPRPGVWPPVDPQSHPERSPGGISTWLWGAGESFRSSHSPRATSSPGSITQAPPQGFGFTLEAGESFAACVEEKDLAELGDLLPPKEIQENLLSLYFAHVHPVFPIVHKTLFLKKYRDV